MKDDPRHTQLSHHKKQAKNRHATVLCNNSQNVIMDVLVVSWTDSPKAVRENCREIGGERIIDSVTFRVIYFQASSWLVAFSQVLR